MDPSPLSTKGTGIDHEMDQVMKAMECWTDTLKEYKVILNFAKMGWNQKITEKLGARGKIQIMEQEWKNKGWKGSIYGSVEEKFSSAVDETRKGISFQMELLRILTVFVSSALQINWGLSKRCGRCFSALEKLTGRN